MTSVHREELIRALPYVRRYARALTGTQEAGDQLVAASLEAVLRHEPPPGDLQTALYREVTIRFTRKDGARSSERASPLTHQQRTLMLLVSLEELPVDRAASIVGLHPDAAKAMLEAGRDRLREATATDVLIIEDEPIIAMDLEELVQSCGHRIVGVAATEREAVEIAKRTRPGLILADINLGAGGDGTAAVARIMQSHQAPVIFVTAYPERLLTGEAIEPAFVITKPFDPMTLAVATFQAVTGGVDLG
ncbi:MAG: response regulator [Acetobacteraceae bacterium]|nr:response regulator [Acetobacteraceae bacterium]